MVTLRDTGIGISADMLPRVFDLFTQGDRENGRAQGGLGIGLTLARTLISLHGGTLDVISDGPGHGTEFVAELPLAESQDIQASVPLSDKESSAIAQQRILVVDDNRDAANSLSILLEYLGADVMTVHGGQDALEAIPKYRPAVALVDIGMPDLDGNEVARRARTLPEGRDVILIALTGWGQDEDRRRSHDAGFDHHLVKPVNVEALQALLSSMLERRRSVNHSAH